jgi:methionyl-tRNA formyltransferase
VNQTGGSPEMTEHLRIVFMGTPDFAVSSLEVLAGGQHEVVAVVTRPDAPRGRGRKLTAPPVKAAALNLGLPVIQPESLREPAFLDELRVFAPDIIVVVAFRLLPPELLAIPRIGCINLHGSLLPRYRGAAPIQWAVINGDTVTGVTVFLLDPTVDTGRILRQKSVDIGENETAGELFDRLCPIGATEVALAVDGLARGAITPISQDDSLATSARKLTKDDGRIDWSQTSTDIRNLVRGTNPAPGAHTFLDGQPFGIGRVDIAVDIPGGSPGELVLIDQKRGVAVATGDGALWLTEVKPPGKRAMPGADWVRGARPEVGLQFTSKVSS